MRHDLSASEVAAVLGVSDNAAHAMLSRVRAQFERSLGALLVARLSSCPTCTTVERREMSPAALLAVLPLLPPPVLARSRIFEDKTELVAGSRKLAERAGPWEVDGWPGVVAPRRRRPATLAVVAVVLLLLGGVESVRLLTVDQPREVTEPVDASVTSSPTSSGASQALYAVADRVTLRPRPWPSSPTASPSPSAAETPVSDATTAAPSVRPSPTSTPTTAAPAPTDVAPVPGSLVVAPRALRLAPGGTGRVQLAARGGALDWRATPDPHLSLSARSGHLAAGAKVVVMITLSPDTPSTVSSQRVLFNGIEVTVRVCTPGAAAC